MNDREKMAALCQKVYVERQKYYDTIGAELNQILGPGATEEEIRALEKFVDCTLPPSYKLLLSIHNGWTHWEGDIDLLSVDQMLEGDYARWITSWKIQAEKQNENLVADCLVIAVQLYAGSGLLIDLEDAGPDGECTVINWDNGPVGRYANFFEVLEQDAEEWASLTDEEQDNG